MCSITGGGERLHNVLRQMDQSSSVHDNRKPPLTYNGENLFILAGNEDMHKISDEFEFWPDRTTDYGVSCH